ncbi:MAG: hypothetical protein FGM41_03605 [Bacteroidetes bacterium]|nr:hypothetical protein [Bacteroidota bacterium]
MKRIIYTIIFACLSCFVFGQASWIEPETPDVTKTIRLYIDLDKTTNTSLAGNTGPFYIWTWLPFEFPAGHPKANGSGDKAWKNSNDLLIMTKDDAKGARVYYYEMIPTEFYEVPATDVYSKGISFLVKPKDGGGYGDPDLKTEDQVLKVSPPKLTRGFIYQFPATILSNEVTTIFYNNPIDTIPGMINLQEGDAYLWIKCTGTDTLTGQIVTYQPSSFFAAGSNPALEMNKDETGKFYLSMIPYSFFGFSPTFKPKDIECTVRKKNYSTTNDRTADQPKFKFGCD